MLRPVGQEMTKCGHIAGEGNALNKTGSQEPVRNYFNSGKRMQFEPIISETETKWDDSRGDGTQNAQQSKGNARALREEMGVIDYGVN
jgi:hypothetical protein